MQEAPSERAPAAARPEVVASPPIIELSPADQEKLNGLMRAQPPHPPAFPLKNEEHRAVIDAAGPLLACNINRFCDKDTLPPADMKITQPVDVGGMKGTVTVVPGKAKIRIPF